MADSRPTFSVGIEEEYLLVDRDSRELAIDPPAGLMADCRAALGDQVSPEFFPRQIEVATRVASNFTDARHDLAHLRRTVADCAAEYRLAPVAAGIHPFSDWNQQLEALRAVVDHLIAETVAHCGTPGRTRRRVERPAQRSRLAL